MNSATSVWIEVYKTNVSKVEATLYLTKKNQLSITFHSNKTTSDICPRTFATPVKRKRIERYPQAQCHQKLTEWTYFFERHFYTIL